MKQLTFFLILILLLIQSCSNQESSNNALIDVPIVIDIDAVKSKPLKLSHIQYIPLETSEECLIGRASKMLVRNSKIYVADFSKSMSLFVFDMNGKFLFKIANRGQGPGEYISFNDFDIQSNGDIYMFDQHRKKFLIHNSEGEYLRDVNSDYYFGKFCIVNNKMYWSKLRESGQMFANLAVYDMTNKTTEFILKDEKFLHPLELVNASSYDFYYSPDNIVYYSPKFSEIIYSVNENGVRPAIGIKNLNIPSKDVINGWLQITDIFERAIQTDNSGYFLENVYIYETDKYITFICKKGVINDFLFYNKISKSVCGVFFHEFFSSIGIDKVLGSTGKEFFSVINFNPDNELHKQILESREELKNWKEDDNPVIVFFTPDM
ncbi:hypothetical protein AGMMS50239_12030 [Bacteroidia bacterium]|nr:hypothetical protein AGMMS50239_12030 [Bacteroidia bacterium]